MKILSREQQLHVSCRNNYKMQHFDKFSKQYVSFDIIWKSYQLPQKHRVRLRDKEQGLGSNPYSLVLLWIMPLGETQYKIVYCITESPTRAGVSARGCGFCGSRLLRCARCASVHRDRERRFPFKSNSFFQTRASECPRPSLINLDKQQPLQNLLEFCRERVFEKKQYVLNFPNSAFAQCFNALAIAPLTCSTFIRFCKGALTVKSDWVETCNPN